MPDGHSHSEYRHKSLESGVMRKYHAPFGGRPTEKGSNQEYLAGGPPYLIHGSYTEDMAQGELQSHAENSGR